MTTLEKAIETFSDQTWRLNNLYRIVDKDGKEVQFRLNAAQEKFWNEYYYRNIILKARQRGFTTLIQLFMLDTALFNSNIQCGTIADTLKNAELIFRNKVKFPYDHLPEGIRNNRPAVIDSARTMTFNNGSALVVDTSLRGGTYQYLHVSEFGRLAVLSPNKAEEIRTGAFNTVPPNGCIFVESTAHGQAGDFFDMCERAKSLQRRKIKLTKLDFKFHFYPWWQAPEYALPDAVEIPAEMTRYFAKLEEQGIHLSQPQKNWYVKMAEEQGSKMTREYPSSPEEAFEASNDGAYYGDQMAKAEAEGRITRVPYDPAVPVETWWDLGLDDYMSIWFVQHVGPQKHAIDHYQNNGEGFDHYAKVLQDKGYVYGKHLGPHDIEARILGRKAVKRKEQAREAGINFTTVPRTTDTGVGIDAVRAMLNSCWFDAERCSEGITSLKSYRHQWDEKTGRWKDTPYHDEHSDNADAFRTGAEYHSQNRGGGTLKPPPPLRAGSWMGR